MENSTNIPPVALKWILDYGSPSNVDLAQWSNVCRAWRHAVSQAILDQVIIPSSDNESQPTQAAAGNSNRHKNATKPCTLLLLPSMVSELVRTKQRERTLTTSSSNHHRPSNASEPSLELTATTSSISESIADNNRNASTSLRRETFCAAWFAPEGIRWFDIDEHDQYERQQERKRQEQRQQQQQTAAAEPFAPGGGDSYAGSDDDDNHHHHHQKVARHQQNNDNNASTASHMMVDHPHRRHVRNHLKQGIAKAAAATSGRQHHQQPPLVQQQRSISPKSSKSPNHHRPPKLEQLPASAVTASWSRTNKTKNVTMSSPHHRSPPSTGLRHASLVSPEWRGYQHAVEVLEPFGYAVSFVEGLMQMAEQRAMTDVEKQRALLPPEPGSNQEEHVAVVVTSGSADNGENDINNDDHHRYTRNHYRNTSQGTSYQQSTHAVRGATVARPEGYCLCWDDPALLSDFSPPVHWTRVDSNSKDQDPCRRRELSQEMYTIRAQERIEQQERRKEWRRQLQKVVLPRVLATKLNHHNISPTHYNKKGNRMEQGNHPTQQHSQYKPRFLQFLNSDGSHAVRLLTPPFACGPIVEPVTILLVGIATEDGCFLSGLRHRFELGHMYPDTEIAAVAELSPVCIATDAWEALRTEEQSSPGGGMQQQQPFLSASRDGSSLDDDSSRDSDDSSSELVSGGRTRGQEYCNCVFHNCNRTGLQGSHGDHSSSNGGGAVDDVSETVREIDDEDGIDTQAQQKNSQHNEDDDEDVAERIIRGQRVPGTWHCYTAIVDGDRSVIRMDGVEEVISIDQSNTNHSESNSEITAGEVVMNNNNNARPNNRWLSSSASSRRRTMLDGLTIGSDHSFDMSLCFGQGSGGEGEGAIAEIAVFHGRLDLVDVETLERRLMSKHRIRAPLREGTDLAKDDHFARQAHALYCQAPIDQNAAHIQRPSAPSPSSSSPGMPFAFADGIPLRFMARHRSVAWHQFDAVTGEELKIKRIGSRSVGSSSDW